MSSVLIPKLTTEFKASTSKSQPIYSMTAFSIDIHLPWSIPVVCTPLLHSQDSTFQIGHKLSPTDSACKSQVDLQGSHSHQKVGHLLHCKLHKGLITCSIWVNAVKDTVLILREKSTHLRYWADMWPPHQHCGRTGLHFQPDHLSNPRAAFLTQHTSHSWAKCGHFHLVSDLNSEQQHLYSIIGAFK